MLKRIVTILSIITAVTLIVLIAAGCGGEEPAETQPAEELVAEENLSRIIDQLRKMALTVEIVEEGNTLVKWSQDGEGSWRFEDPSQPGDYTIFNAKQTKGWQVSGQTAIEFTDPAALQALESYNPVTLLGSFATFALLPRTGGDSDVSEWNIPGQGTLKIEFKGPEGLVSRVTADLLQMGKTDLEFRYSNVGSVPAGTFELPEGVEVTKTETGIPGGFEVPSPDEGLPGGDEFEFPTDGGGFDDTIEVPGPPTE